jgi:hypothetical protein
MGVCCASSDLSTTPRALAGLSANPEELRREGGVDKEMEWVLRLGAKFVVGIAAFPSGEVRILAEAKLIGGDVTARLPEFPGAVGRPFPRAATLFPYSSRLFVEPVSSSGGAPIAKLPRGMGMPPFFSNLAILSRRLPRGGVTDASREGNVGDEVGEGVPLRC